jgi:hypothetical protein
MSYHRFGQFDLRQTTVPTTIREIPPPSEDVPMPGGSQEYQVATRIDPVALPTREPLRMDPVVASPIEPTISTTRYEQPRLPAAEEPFVLPSAQITTRGTPVAAPNPSYPIIRAYTPTAPIEPPPVSCPPGYEPGEPGTRSECIPIPYPPPPPNPSGPIAVPYPCPEGMKWIQWRVGPKAGQEECIPAHLDPAELIAQQAPSSAPITQQAPPAHAPITQQAPPAHAPITQQTAATAQINHGPVALQIQQQQAAAAAAAALAQQQKSSIGMMAIAAGAAVLLAKLL